MGVAGSGKTTVGGAAAGSLGFPFLDADDFHSPTDRAAMASGIPLDDRQRDCWIERVHSAMDGHSEVVLVCSALRRVHRERLRSVGAVQMYFLEVPADVLARRLGQRHAHFFPASLLASQLAALDPIAPDEGVVVLDGDRPVSVLADAIVTDVRRSGIGPAAPAG